MTEETDRKLENLELRCHAQLASRHITAAPRNRNVYASSCCRVDALRMRSPKKSTAIRSTCHASSAMMDRNCCQLMGSPRHRPDNLRCMHGRSRAFDGSCSSSSHECNITSAMVSGTATCTIAAFISRTSAM